MAMSTCRNASRAALVISTLRALNRAITSYRTDAEVVSAVATIMRTTAIARLIEPPLTAASAVLKEPPPLEGEQSAFHPVEADECRISGNGCEQYQSSYRPPC